MDGQSKPWLIPTGADAKLCERLQMVQFNLIQLRRAFWRRGYLALAAKDRQALLDGGCVPRLNLFVKTLRYAWTGPLWARWLDYTRHTDRDFDEMCRAEYPVSPLMIRTFSAVFGLKVEFFLLGEVPTVDRAGTNIDAWPRSGAR